MTEEQLTLWTMSSPIFLEYYSAMQDFNSLSYTTSEQHKEFSETRIKRDLSDLAKLNSKLDFCTPFPLDHSLRNIVNDIVAKDDVNVHELRVG